eukprot:403335806
MIKKNLKTMSSLVKNCYQPLDHHHFRYSRLQSPVFQNSHLLFCDRFRHFSSKLNQRDTENDILRKEAKIDQINKKDEELVYRQCLFEDDSQIFQDSEIHTDPFTLDRNHTLIFKASFLLTIYKYTFFFRSICFSWLLCITIPMNYSFMSRQGAWKDRLTARLVKTIHLSSCGMYIDLKTLENETKTIPISSLREPSRRELYHLEHIKMVFAQGLDFEKYDRDNYKYDIVVVESDGTENLNEHYFIPKYPRITEFENVFQAVLKGQEIKNQ